MPTPPKPVIVLENEKRSHRTKAEISQRKEAEKETLSGTILKERPETKKNKAAHKEFLRIKNVLSNIKKNDGIYEPVINRYCLIQAECLDFEEKREKIYDLIQKLEEEYTANIENVDAKSRFQFMMEFAREVGRLTALMISVDKQVQTKRKALLDIEDKNIMTIAGALRSIPKKTEGKKVGNGLRQVLGS